MRKTRFRNALKKQSEHFHMIVHLLLGGLSGVVAWELFKGDMDHFIFIGVMGNLFPDVDHVAYVFLYGRKSPYAQQIKSFLKQRKIKEHVKFLTYNHKENTGLYFHNVLMVFMVSFLVGTFFQAKIASWFAFSLSWALHYLYDMAEDVLFFGQLNPNWLLHFNKERHT